MAKLPKMRSFKIYELAFALLFSCPLLAAQDLPVDQRENDHRVNNDAKFKIAGMVVSSLTGTPLSQARVTLADTADGRNTAFIITTDNGRFTFAPLSRGKYALEGARRGFIPAAYEQHEQFSTAIVTGTGLNTENLVLRLTPLAQLSGKVIDETGDPIRKANVTLYLEDHEAGMKRTIPIGNDSTDDEGYYEFAALVPGNYFVSVSATPWYAVHSFPSTARPNNLPPNVKPSLDVAYPATFNNGATDSQAATPITVHGGDHLQVDVHISPVPVLHLIFHAPGDEQQGFATPLFEKRVFDSVEYTNFDGMRPISPGVYELTGIPAGKYSVRMQGPGSPQTQQSNEMNLVKDGQELDVAQSLPSASVKFTVTMPAREPQPKQLSIALRDSRMQVVGFQPVDPTGAAAFEDLPAGKYSIVVFSPKKRYSVVRTINSGVEIPGHDLNATPGSNLSLTVFLAGGIVSVEGFVMRAGKASSGIMVALIPKDPQSHLDMFRRDQSDSDGSFVLRDVIPGTYTLIAVEDAWGFPWQQPESLKGYLEHGQNLTVGELMSNSVHLPDPIEAQPH
jgi:Carboxypeptidase regulatory-like domain